MADTLGWRLKLGVLVPSTNTAVQPEYDAMRPPGVTNHVRGFRIPNASMYRPSRSKSPRAASASPRASRSHPRAPRK